MPNYTAPSNRPVLVAVLAALSCTPLGCSLFEPESRFQCFKPDCKAPDSGISGSDAGGSDAGGDAGTSGTSDSGSDGGDASEMGRDAGSACMQCGAGLVCDGVNGQCVQCLGDDDCESSAPICTVDHRCVACVLDSDCPSTAPACNDHNVCVGCTDSARHCGGDTPFCDTTSHACLQCLSSSDCTDPSASRCSNGTCQPCTRAPDCKHLNDLGVCDTRSGTGQCVRCTGTQYAACGTDPVTNRPFVCDSKNRTCSDRAEASSGLCGECVSDAQCPAGQLCVLQEFESATIGYFCMWQKQAGVGGAPTSCSNARPYVKAVANTDSIDGRTAEVCTLALSTCPAHQDFRGTNCSGDTPTGDAPCGFEGVADGYCRLFESGLGLIRSRRQVAYAAIIGPAALSYSPGLT